MANNLRKMMRSMKPTSGGMHDVSPPHGARPSPGVKALRRAAKKQIKTREERAWRDEN